MNYQSFTQRLERVRECLGNACASPALLKAVFEAVEAATRNRCSSAHRLEQLALLLDHYVEAALGKGLEIPSVDTEQHPAKLEAWCAYLEAARALEDEFAQSLLPFNKGVVRFGQPGQRTTTQCVHDWIQKMLLAHRHCLDELVQGAFERYRKEEAMHNASSVWTRWVALMVPFQGTWESTPMFADIPSSVIPHLIVHVGDVHSMPLEQALFVMTRLYYAELVYTGSANEHCCPEQSARRLCDAVGASHSWKVMETRLFSANPVDGRPTLFYHPPTLFYHPQLLKAFEEMDVQTIQRFGELFASVPFFNHCLWFEGSNLQHLFYAYLRASVRLHKTLTTAHLRKVWRCMYTVFDGDGPGGCFKCTSEVNTPLPSVERERVTKSVLWLLSEAHYRRTAQDELQRHVLTPLLTMMMDPHTDLSDWDSDGPWFRDFLEVSFGRETLLWEYLENLKQRLLRDAFDPDAEMDLMVCFSVQFRHAPSRALQHYRLLLEPCSIHPDVPAELGVDKVHITPACVRRKVAALPSSSLHPTLQEWYEQVKQSYSDTFSERRASIDQWHTTMDLVCEPDGKPPYTLHASLAAVSLVALVADEEKGVTHDDLMQWCLTDPRDETSRPGPRYIDFWLDVLTKAGVLTINTSAEDDADETPTYRVATWEGTYTLPVPPVPEWAYDDGPADDTETLVGARPLHQQERLLTVKELVESLCFRCLKNATEPVPCERLVTSLVEQARPQVQVTPEEVRETIDALMRKDFLVCNKGTYQLYDDDDDEVDDEATKRRTDDGSDNGESSDSVDELAFEFGIVD